MLTRTNLILISAGLAIVSGCSSNSSSHRYSDRYDRGRYDGAETAGYRMGDSGVGPVDYTASSAGTVVVMDRDDNNRVILSQRVRSGDRVVIQPDQDRVLLNGQTVYGRNLVHDHRHSIEFRPDSDGNRWDNRSDDRGQWDRPQQWRY